ncbi:MAG: 30S ribosomal protein S20 [Bacteriovoracales bacterium]|nr:30S ribosomal protein S20 [Bacteriovoracales bacterium]
MANHKSAKKRARQTLKKTFVNKNRLTRARTAIRTLGKTMEGKDPSATDSLLRNVQGLLAKTNLHPKTIARKTSRLARKAVNTSSSNS